MLWILETGILEVLKQALKISQNSLLMSHLKTAIMLPLPQRRVVTIFWKLLGHYCKDISWSSCPEDSFEWCSINKEVRNSYAATMLGCSMLLLVSLAAPGRFNWSCSPNVQLCSVQTARVWYCAPFFLAAFSIAKWIWLRASWIKISDLEQLPDLFCSVVLMWVSRWSKGAVRPSACCCGWCSLKQGSTAPGPVQKAPE